LGSVLDGLSQDKKAQPTRVSSEAASICSGIVPTQQPGPREAYGAAAATLALLKGASHYGIGPRHPSSGGQSLALRARSRSRESPPAAALATVAHGAGLASEAETDRNVCIRSRLYSGRLPGRTLSSG